MEMPLLEEKLAALTKLPNNERSKLWQAIYAREEARGHDAWTRHIPELASEMDEFALNIYENMLDDEDIGDQHKKCLHKLNIKRGSATDIELRTMLQSTLKLALAKGGFSRLIYPKGY
jgi:hypothetical protein